MDGVTLIHTKDLQILFKRIENMEQMLLSIIKEKNAPNAPTRSNQTPDFISIEDLTTKYHLSRVTVNNKIRLFKETFKREIDRLQSGSFKLINELEFIEALKIKTPNQKVIHRNKENNSEKSKNSPHPPPQKNKTPDNSGV